jgi:hypothetical protein
MKRIMMFFILLFLTSFVSGCGHQCQLIRHSYATNYKIGEINTAYAGQNMMSVKDYYVCKGHETTLMEPTEDFTLTANVPGLVSEYILNISGFRIKQYKTCSKLNTDGILYNIICPIDSQGYDDYGILIDEQGTVKNNSVYHNKKIRTAINFMLHPSNVKFNKAVFKYENFLCDSSISSSGNTCGWINYELIYNGINNFSMNMTYREYKRNDYAKPSFYQNLSFEPKTKQIRFKDFVIEILEAYNDSIVYKILSDGLKQTEFNNGENPDFERIKNSR